MIDAQYFEDVKKVVTVSYGKKDYRVQDDGRGFLHIIVFEEGKRKKIGIEKLKQKSFEPGSMADYVFNGWFQIYDSEKMFSEFAKAEVSWLK